MADLYGWDRPSMRFRDLSTGKYISERMVRDYVDNIADLASREMGDLAARYRSGQITFAAWQSESMQVIKSSQIASALAAYGGRDQMNATRWGTVGQQIRIQYQYLRQFGADILSGRQRLNGRLDSRSRLYGQAVRQTYTDIRRRESAANGMLWEKNVLGAAEHCAECVAQAARGWVPIGTLIPPGRRTCRGNCRCSLAHSRTLSESAA
jgi:hypothetical protein